MQNAKQHRVRTGRGTGILTGMVAALAGSFLSGPALSQNQAASSLPPCGGPPSDTRLFVDVTNVASADGLIAVTLYPDDRRRFLARRGSLYVVRVPARSRSVRVCVHLPAPGTYAIAVYHDTNSSRRFDRTGIGLPAEDYGFSNNPAVFLGMPSFGSVRFSVAGDSQVIMVRLRRS